MPRCFLCWPANYHSITLSVTAAILSAFYQPIFMFTAAQAIVPMIVSNETSWDRLLSLQMCAVTNKQLLTPRQYRLQLSDVGTRKCPRSWCGCSGQGTLDGRWSAVGGQTLGGWSNVTTRRGLDSTRLPETVHLRLPVMQ